MSLERPSDLEEFVEHAYGTIIAAEKEAVASGADAADIALLSIDQYVEAILKRSSTYTKQTFTLSIWKSHLFGVKEPESRPLIASSD